MRWSPVQVWRFARIGCVQTPSQSFAQQPLSSLEISGNTGVISINVATSSYRPRPPTRWSPLSWPKNQKFIRKLCAALDGIAITTAIVAFLPYIGLNFLAISMSSMLLSKSPVTKSCSLSRWTCCPFQFQPDKRLSLRWLRMPGSQGTLFQYNKLLCRTARGGAGDRHLPILNRGHQRMAERENHHGVLVHHYNHPCWAIGAICLRQIS